MDTMNMYNANSVVNMSINNVNSVDDMNTSNSVNKADDDYNSSRSDHPSLQFRRRRRHNIDGDELFLSELTTSTSTISTSSNSSSTTSSSTDSPSTNSSPATSPSIESSSGDSPSTDSFPNALKDEKKISDSNVIVETSLVHKPHSDFARNVTKIATATKVGLDIFNVVSKVSLETAKFSTKAGLDIARTVTGVLSERMIQATSLDGNTGR